MNKSKVSFRSRILTSCMLWTMIIAVGLFSSLNIFTTLASEGDLDKAFGSEGKIVTSLLVPGFETSNSELKAMAVQDDGKIIAVGNNNYFTFTLTNTYNDFVLTRYNGDGTLDLSFRGGKVISDISGGGDFANAIAIQPDGKIVVAGFSIIEQQNVFAVARYNGDGSLDQSFGQRGRVFTEFSEMDAQARAVSIQSEGKIVVVGTASKTGLNPCEPGIIGSLALVHYNSDGSPDTNFGNGGKVLTERASLVCSIKHINF